MSEGAGQVPPRLIKSNLRRIVGGHVRAQRLGHYLDFDVVVIPPGRHVTEFPTADAAFHPFENETGEDDEMLEIRLVPWVIFKISANEPLSRKLSAELGSFWRAGVEQIWEIRAWNRTVALLLPDEEPRIFAEGAKLPKCPVLPGLSAGVADIFSGIENEEALPQGVSAGEDEPWRISQQWEKKAVRRLTKNSLSEFVASPELVSHPDDPYGVEPRRGGFHGVADALLGNWVGRIVVGAFALVLLTTMIYLILETQSASSRTLSGGGAEVSPADALSPSGRLELAKATVRAYFQADDPAERLELVRHPEETRLRLLAYYGESPVRKEVVRVFGTSLNLRAKDRDFLVLPTYVEGRQLEIFLEELPEGGYLVDWESEVGYNATRFPVFRSRAEPEPTEFRVFASESDVYAGEFSSEAEFYSVQLHFPESGESAQGYVERASPCFPALLNLVQGQYRARMRLVLDLPEVRSARSTKADRRSGDAPKALPDTASPGPNAIVRIVGLGGDSWLDPE